MCPLSLSDQVECSSGEEKDFLGLRKFILFGLDLERNLSRGLKSRSPSSSLQEDAGCGREVVRSRICSGPLPQLQHDGLFSPHPSLLKGFATTGVLRGCWVCARGQYGAGCGCCSN